MAKAKAQSKSVKAIITNTGYGLYYGEVSSLAQVARDGFAEVRNCRHIAYWEGGWGGITALAATGPAGKSRIGPPIARAMIRNVANAFLVEPAAAAAFEAWVTRAQ